MAGKGVIHPDLLMARKAEEIDVIRAERQRIYDNMHQVSESVTAQSVAGWDEVVINMVRDELKRHWVQYQAENGNLIDALSEVTSQRQAREEAIVVAREVSKVQSVLENRYKELPSQQPRVPIKPSEIVLPIFDGTYTAWVAWRSQFVNKVLSTSLSADSKIDLLLGSLRGEALQCAGESERRDQVDFDRIWKKLEATYDNRYQIVTQHVNRLLDLPVLTSASANLLRLIIDTVEQELRSLHRFGYLTDGWDPLVAVIMLRKLDPTTLSIWEMDRDPVKAPSKDDVIKFIEKRILALRNLSAARPVSVGSTSHSHQHHERSHNYGRNSHSQKRRHDAHSAQVSVNPFSHKRNDDHAATSESKRIRVPHVNEQLHHKEVKPPPKCPECDKLHYMWFCPVFKSWDLDKRLKQVGLWKLCPCCLISRHASAECRERGCPRCDNAKHNNMLCPKSIVFRSNLIVDRSRKGRRGRPAQP